jgi:hypothetical protein
MEQIIDDAAAGRRFQMDLAAAFALAALATFRLKIPEVGPDRCRNAKTGPSMQGASWISEN